MEELKKNKKDILKNFSKKVGLVSLAILWCLAERGAGVLVEMLGANRREGLGRSLRRISEMKDVDDYYEILKSLDKNTAKTAIWRLEKKGLVRKGSDGLSLTKAGFLFGAALVKKPRETWDGKFRIVMFDIPESRKKQRDFVRRGLLRQEYVPLQKSVLIGKMPLEKDFAQQLIDKELYQFVRMIIVGDIDDKSILEHLS